MIGLTELMEQVYPLPLLLLSDWHCHFLHYLNRCPPPLLTAIEPYQLTSYALMQQSLSSRPSNPITYLLNYLLDH